MEKIELLKRNNVDVDASLEFWGDLESYNENLKEFWKSLDKKIADLEFSKESEDWSNYAIVAHSTKSEAKYLGFNEYAEIFLTHEQKGKENDGEYIKANFDALKETIQNIKDILSKYFKSVNASSGKKILTADDSSIILNFIEKNLDEEYTCIRAKDGNEALEKLENENIYAFLLDLNMPHLDGFKVLDYLEENDLFMTIPVIVITGDDSEDTIKKAFKYPILDVLNKPFTEDNIKRVLISIKNFHEKR